MGEALFALELTKEIIRSIMKKIPEKGAVKMNKLCKRMIALLLAVLLMTAMAGGALADDDASVNVLDLTLLDQASYTAADWWENYTSKTVLAVCTYCDIVLDDNAAWERIADEATKDGKIYVARADDCLTIYFFGDTELVSVFYVPSIKMAMVIAADLPASTAAASMAKLKTDGTISEYTAIDREDFSTAFGVLIEMINEE